MEYQGDYNLDEIDANLSSPAHQGAFSAAPGGADIGPRRLGSVSRSRPASIRKIPGTRRGSAATMPGTVPPIRRGSLMPGSDPCNALSNRQHDTHELNLFHFDNQDLIRDMLLPDGEGESKVSYHEFAVFSPPKSCPEGEPSSPSIMAKGEEALQMFHDAFKNGHGLDDDPSVNFTPNPKGESRLLGRVRQVIVDRRTRPHPPNNAQDSDGLSLTRSDYDSLALHSGTLPSAQRITVESFFWNMRKDTLYLILSFSANPQPPYDFLSMTYKLRTRTTNALIRKSFNTRWHDEDALDEYEQRLDSCRSRWTHPFVLPVVMLQVQLLRMEERVLENNQDVKELERRVTDLTDTKGQEAMRARRWNSNHRSDTASLLPLRRLSTLKSFVAEKVGRPNSYPRDDIELDEDYEPPQTIHLMKEAHDVLKGAIKLLDTLRWMERVINLLLKAGDELDVRVQQIRHPSKGREENEDKDSFDDLAYHWHEIRQYLNCILRLCTSLETDRRMSELRCRAQIDIIYSKMAQEDNNLNARMAVASTRDSSSMKALAVITAIFLPGEYIGTLFGMGDMFEWEKGTAGDPMASNDTMEGFPNPVIRPLFWVYWAFTLPLTIFIVVLWRAWWVNQDRYFRRHLSTELSNERYWTTDGKPRDLETSFVQDFFSLFSRSGARSSTNNTILGSSRKRTMSADSHSQGLNMNRRGLTLSEDTSTTKDAENAEIEDNNRFGSRGTRLRFARQVDQRETTLPI